MENKTVVARYVGPLYSPLKAHIEALAGRPADRSEILSPMIGGQIMTSTALYFKCKSEAEAASIAKALEPAAGVEVIVQ